MSDPVVTAEVDLGVLREVIGFRLRRIQNHLSRGFSQRLEADEDIKPGAFSSLALIGANPGISQTELSRAVGFDKATVVALLDQLERLKWAERKRSAKDRRRHSLHITDKGSKALESMVAEAIANEKRVRDTLSKAEQAQLFGLLDKIYMTVFQFERD